MTPFGIIIIDFFNIITYYYHFRIIIIFLIIIFIYLYFNNSTRHDKVGGMFCVSRFVGTREEVDGYGV